MNGLSSIDWPVMIRRARLRMGLKQHELAALAGLTRVCVSNHERGTNAPGAGAIAAYRRVLGREFEGRSLVDQFRDGVVAYLLAEAARCEDKRMFEAGSVLRRVAVDLPPVEPTSGKAAER